MNIYQGSLHQRMQTALDQHKPARRHDGLLVVSEDRQTTCLCGHWTHGSYDEHVAVAVREAVAR